MLRQELGSKKLFHAPLTHNFLNIKEWQFHLGGSLKSSHAIILYELCGRGSSPLCALPCMVATCELYGSHTVILYIKDF